MQFLLDVFQKVVNWYIFPSLFFFHSLLISYSIEMFIVFQRVKYIPETKKGFSLFLIVTSLFFVMLL